MPNNRKPIKKATSSQPHNSDAERAVLGSAILSSSAATEIVSSLREDDFYEGRHQIIFRGIFNLIEKKVNVDILTLTEELANLKELENVGGVKYLQECADSMVALSSLEFYINIVNDQSVLRKMLNTIRDIDKSYLEEEVEDVNDFIIRAENSFKDSIARRKVSNFKSVEEIAGRVRLQIDQMVLTKEQNKSEEEKDLVGLNTGFEKINKLTLGFQPSQLIIVAARPAVGKTALALNFAANVAKYEGVPVAIFELEMDADMLVKRLVSSSSSVSLTKIQSGQLTDNDKLRVSGAIRELSQEPIFIDDSPGLNLVDIVAKAKKLQSIHKDLGLIIVDYLGLVQYGGKTAASKSDSRQEEVRKISLALKDLARELKVPVIAVSQLSRDVEKRDSKRPMMSDLRDSGSIEQDADVIMLLYREDYYDKTNKKSGFANKQGGELSDNEKRKMAMEAEKQRMLESHQGAVSYVEVNIAKNRNGQTGKAGLFFFKDFGRFDSVSKDYEQKLDQIENDID